MDSKFLLKEHLYELEQKLLKSEIRKSQDELSKLLGDDFFEFGSSGRVWYKKDCIGEEGMGVVKMALSDFEIHPLSKDAVLTTYRIFDEIKLQHTLRSSIWKFRDERWQMFFHQGTPTQFLWMENKVNILIIQPKLEKGIAQLENELRRNPTVDIVIFPEGYLNENVDQACELAKNTNTILIGGHRRLNESPKDRAIIINRKGDIVLDRIKYSPTLFIVEEELRVGHILCDELVIQGVNSEEASDIDLIVHPIGVGMFSKEQFDEWISEAAKIAIKHKTMIIGTSHADGSFRDTGVSIPIAYCLDKEGAVVFISENDVRTRLLNFKTKKYQFPGIQ